MASLRTIVAIVLVYAMLPSARAAEEAPNPAKAHYDKAEELYNQGSYDEAIVEYHEAYRLKPHWNVLYNIAQAYERLLDYAQSVTWFERYLSEAPLDAPSASTSRTGSRCCATCRRASRSRRSPSMCTPPSSPATASGATPTPRRCSRCRRGALDRAFADGLGSPSRMTSMSKIGQPYFYQYRLKRSTAQVTIFTRPRGARVFIDERARWGGGRRRLPGPSTSAATSCCSSIATIRGTARSSTCSRARRSSAR